MNNGIFDITAKKFYAMGRRSELTTRQEIKELLKIHHHHSELCCGCGIAAGRFLRLIPALTGDQKGTLTIAREDIDDHPRGCIFRRASDGEEVEVRRASSIFGPVRVREDHDPNSPAIESNDRAQYDSYADYALRVFSRGLTLAYISRNQGLDVHVNPTAAEVFAGVHAAVKQLLFTSGADGYAEVQSRDLRLRFGLVFDPVISDEVPNTNMNVYWWKDGVYSLGLVHAQAEAMAAAAADLRIFDNFQSPPYFILAVQDENSGLQRVFLHQVAVSEQYLIAADSGRECVFAVNLIEKGAALIKAVRMDDFEHLLATFGVTLLNNATWRYRPDFVALWRRRQGLTLQIRELRGFKEGTKPEYDALLLGKEEYYNALSASIPANYDEIDGTHMRWEPPAQGPEAWPTAIVIFEAPSADLMI